ncbi:formylglycine-generating enzyme family protein [Pedobacter gandavensis]|uniref:SUMF1/EgtB/PvdO family nonheme iron enzyme n=1 Tax=Pedobacter gandavensis TaxID=2679963 RepID=A0ABR6ETT0_9SPHI|nr:SUMF1/EgtB/PvdO family nonheme iron enzyme [Pedobacter gandavensis]MBB2148674.1 SUMF1/EgtB/PvdO family nonheme iron enzyme [Pedobacter gandavensis]
MDVKSKVIWVFLLLSSCLFVQQTVAQSDTGFVHIPKGEYWLGGRIHQLNPLRKVSTAGFDLAATELTNRLFEKFILATNYKTDAERFKNAMVFEPGLAEFKWLSDSTAYWRFPNGISRGGIENKMNHPVTCISYTDAEAYCKWAKVRLPSLDEWEIASRAGAKTTYFWGDNMDQIAEYANIWHGRDHLSPDLSDGYMYTAPVASFKPNAFGLYDMYGNVFEFCEGTLKTDPKNRRVVHARGGSWWCSNYACGFFNSLDVGRVNPRASFSNQGFRVLKNQTK